jgi:hypothetical protein
MRPHPPPRRRSQRIADSDRTIIFLVLVVVLVLDLIPPYPAISHRRERRETQRPQRRVIVSGAVGWWGAVAPFPFLEKPQNSQKYIDRSATVFQQRAKELKSCCLTGLTGLTSLTIME